MESLFFFLIPLVAAEQNEAPGITGLGGPLSLMLIMFVIFYVLLIRPQRKYQRERQAMIQALQKHDQGDQGPEYIHGGMQGIGD